VEIIGSNFIPGAPTTVKFGNAGSVTGTAVDSTHITVISPAYSIAETLDVTVTTLESTSREAPADKFSYYDPGAVPTIISVTPSYGKINIETPVEIIGSNFIPGAPTTVKFGNAGSVMGTAVDSTHIIATSPAYGIAGTLDVTVNTLGGTSSEVPADKFTYYGVPTVGAVSPASGSTAGGTTVTIDGSNFGTVIANVSVCLEIIKLMLRQWLIINNGDFTI